MGRAMCVDRGDRLLFAPYGPKPCVAVFVRYLRMHMYEGECRYIMGIRCERCQCGCGVIVCYYPLVERTGVTGARHDHALCTK